MMAVPDLSLEATRLRRNEAAGGWTTTLINRRDCQAWSASLHVTCPSLPRCRPATVHQPSLRLPRWPVSLSRSKGEPARCWA
jgi:hypothetical protein